MLPVASGTYPRNTGRCSDPRCPTRNRPVCIDVLFGVRSSSSLVLSLTLLGVGAQAGTRLVVFAARLTPTTAVAGCLCVLFCFPAFCFQGRRSFSPITSDALALFIDLLYTAWPPPRCFPVFSCWVLFFPVGQMACLRSLCFWWLRFWFWVFVRFLVRPACGLAWFVSPPPPSPFAPLCCLLVLCVFASLSCTQQPGDVAPRPLPAHYLARPSLPASCWRDVGGTRGVVGR